MHVCAIFSSRSLLPFLVIADIFLFKLKILPRKIYQNAR